MPSFSQDELEALQQHLSKVIEKALKAGITSAAMRLIGVIQNEIIPAENPPPIFNRAYTAGFHVEPTDVGTDIVNTIPYASVIEYGARAENIRIGTAMIDALTQWVQRKGLASSDLEARRIAWAIAVTMKKRGNFNRDGGEGLRIAEKAAKQAPALVAEEIAREMKRALG